MSLHSNIYVCGRARGRAGARSRRFARCACACCPSPRPTPPPRREASRTKEVLSTSLESGLQVCSRAEPAEPACPARKHRHCGQSWTPRCGSRLMCTARRCTARAPWTRAQVSISSSSARASRERGRSRSAGPRTLSSASAMTTRPEGW